MSGSPLIYCVEDDDSIRELICYALKSGGYQAEGFAESGDFWRRTLVFDCATYLFE